MEDTIGFWWPRGICAIIEWYSIKFNSKHPIIHNYVLHIQSIKFIKILFNLFAGQNVEFPILSDDGNLDVVIVHLALKTFFEGQEGSVDGIFDLHIGFESLLQESFGILGTFSDCSGLPVVECPWWV